MKEEGQRDREEEMVGAVPQHLHRRVGEACKGQLRCQTVEGLGIHTGLRPVAGQL